MRFSISLLKSSFIFCVVIFNSYVTFFIVSFVSLWCLLKSFLSSFICFYVFSCSLFLVSWNFFNVSCTSLLTMSSIFTKSFSVISSKISSLGFFCGCHWAPYWHLSLFCWGSQWEMN
jgi:hypothetical protein